MLDCGGGCVAAPPKDLGVLPLAVGASSGASKALPDQPEAPPTRPATLWLITALFYTVLARTLHAYATAWLSSQGCPWWDPPGGCPYSRPGTWFNPSGH